MHERSGHHGAGAHPEAQRFLPLPFPLRGRGGGRFPAGRVEPCDARAVPEPPAGGVVVDAPVVVAVPPRDLAVDEAPAPGRMTPEP